MAATADLKVRTKVELESVAIVRPGDSLVVAVQSELTEQQVVEYRRYLGERLPGVDIVVVHATQLAVYRPAEHDRAESVRGSARA